MLTIVLATGGTGGHIFPALAAAEEFKRVLKDEVKILLIGGKYGQEYKLFPKDKYQCFHLPVKGLKGKGFKTIGNIFWVLFSMVICNRILNRIDPDVVVGFGSYASFVPVYLANRKKIPTCIHEQNSYPGITNRILGKRVDRIFLSFPDEFGLFDKQKVKVVGNPIRKNIIEAAQKDKPQIFGGTNKLNLLVLGGSQGAKAINDAIINSLSIIKKLGVKIYHQTGDFDFYRVLKAYKEQNIDSCKVVPFIEDMAGAYLWADLVVCRAGASTIFELAAMGKPSILIPYPYATENHQKINASYLERVGGAVVVEQALLETRPIGNIISDIISIPSKLKEMGKYAKSAAKLNATRELIQGVLELVNV